MFRGIKEFTLETEHQRECSLKVRTFSGSFVRIANTPFDKIDEEPSDTMSDTNI